MTATKTPSWVVSSLREVAAFFRVAYQTVRTDWRAKGVVPEERPEGGYDLSAIFIAWRDRERENELKNQTGRPSKGNANALVVQKLEKQIGKLNEEIRRLDRENQCQEGELLVRDEVESYLIQRMVQFRAPLMRLPDRVASRVPGGMKAAVKHEVEADVIATLQMIVDMRPHEHSSTTMGQLICAEADEIRAKQNGRATKNRA